MALREAPATALVSSPCCCSRRCASDSDDCRETVQYCSNTVLTQETMAHYLVLQRLLRILTAMSAGAIEMRIAHKSWHTICCSIRAACHSARHTWQGWLSQNWIIA